MFLSLAYFIRVSLWLALGILLNPYAFTPYCSGIFGTYTFARKKYVEFIAIFTLALIAIKNKYLKKLKNKANSIAKVIVSSTGKASKMAKHAM